MIIKSTTGSGIAVQLKQIFPAPREKVFRAWTEPEELKKWWGPAGCILPFAQVDLRVGGQYRFGMQYPPADIFYLTGTYREIRPPEKLVFTWRWENPDMDKGESLVTVEFRDLGDATEVVLTHQRFPDEAVAAQHNQGWASIFAELNQYVAGKEG